MRRKERHVGHHHHHLTRLQARVGVQPGQQMVVQDFNLALGAVGADKTDRPIDRLRHRYRRCRRQVQDV